MTIRSSPGILLGLLVLGALAGCAAAGGEDPLDGTSWQLTAMDGAAPLAGRPITLVFEGGALHGSAGCNGYSGSYVVDQGELTISDLFSTLMACLEPGVMEQESSYLLHLSATNRYTLDEDQLQLLALGVQSLNFEAQR